MRDNAYHGSSHGPLPFQQEERSEGTEEVLRTEDGETLKGQFESCVELLESTHGKAKAFAMQPGPARSYFNTITGQLLHRLTKLKTWASAIDLDEPAAVDEARNTRYSVIMARMLNRITSALNEIVKDMETMQAATTQTIAASRIEP